jgi:Family of unknown function (DUF5762)
MTTPIWLADPSILLNKNEITELWPTSAMSKNSKLNAISRLVVLLTLFGFIFIGGFSFIVSGVITLGLIALYSGDINSINKEGFDNKPLTKKNFTMPSKTNTLMNVLMTDYMDDPKRKSAAPAYNHKIERDIVKKTEEGVISNFDDDSIKERLFRDLGDNFELDQSIRPFYATANTQIPSDQNAFAKFCYGDMISCRDEATNSIACVQDNTTLYSQL